MKGSLWLIAPIYAAWREGKSKVSRPMQPFRRWNPKEMRWQIALIVVGSVIIALTFTRGIPVLAIFGTGWAFVGAYRLAARLLIPKRWVGTEMDFAAMTSLGTVIRIGLWVGFVASLALANWTAALGFGLAAALLTLNTVIVLLVLFVARRIATRRRAAGL